MLYAYLEKTVSVENIVRRVSFIQSGLLRLYEGNIYLARTGVVVAPAVVVVEWTSPKADSCRKRSGRVWRWVGEGGGGCRAENTVYIQLYYTRPRLGVERKQPIPLPAAATEESLWEFENDVTLELTRGRFDARIRN